MKDILHSMSVRQFINIKCSVLSKSFKMYVTIQNIDRIICAELHVHMLCI
jgi:2C-methyl-D-erythritol 2,4-cyclodiphosphate synthase